MLRLAAKLSSLTASHDNLPIFHCCYWMGVNKHSQLTISRLILADPSVNLGGAFEG